MPADARAGDAVLDDHDRSMRHRAPETVASFPSLGRVDAAELWRTNGDIGQACLEHPFVQGIARGDLARPAFEFYVAQDAVFLEAFARAYALAIGRAPDRASMDDFKALLDGVFDELGLHAGYAERWGVALDVEPAPATRAYTDFLLRVASLEPVGHLCAAMTPCMRLYAWLGQQLQPDTDPDSPYREWVETYADPEFEALAATLEGLLDRHGGDTARRAGHYRTALELEHGFFSAASAVR